MDQSTATAQAYTAKAQEGRKALESLREETKHPMETMSDFLMQLLEDNKDTEYGKRYDFANIHTIEDYQKKVPVINYHNIAGEISRMQDGEKNILTAYPFNHMNVTSGTVAAPKAVPMTDRQTQVFMKYNNALIYGIMDENLDPDWKNGRAFCTSSSGHCQTLNSGITLGDASSRMAQYLKGGEQELDSIMRVLFTTPVEGLTPKPGTDVKYILSRFALMDKDVRGLITGFFSVAVVYLKYIADNYKMLIDDIESGTINEEIYMQGDVRNSLLSKINPMPERAKELREIFKDGSDFPFVKKVWPHFCYLCGVGGDGFKIYDDLLSQQFTGPEVARVYFGITASEGLWTVPFGINHTESVIALGSAFIEFLPVEAGDDFTQCRTVDELEEGKVYELIVTNLCGFYRYRMSDAVKVVGKYNNTPTVEFMYRVNRTINLACEKTTEKMLQVAVEQTMKDLGVQLADFCVYPDTTVTPNKYVFLVEPWEETCTSKYPNRDEILYEHFTRANPVYEECVQDRWLEKPEMYFTMPQSSLLYRDIMVMRGSSMNQFKPVRVINNQEQKDFFFSVIQPEDEDDA